MKRYRIIYLKDENEVSEIIEARNYYSAKTQFELANAGVQILRIERLSTNEEVVRTLGTDEQTFTNTNAQIAVVITCKLNEWSSHKSLILETVHDVNTNTQMTITEHPIPNATTVADHMYKQPTTMSIRGTFSLNSGQGIVVDSEGAKLANIQELFEKIQNEGAMCEIVKISTVSEDVKFLRRSNMVLQSISWTERINSLDFTFSYRQALVAEVQTYDIDVDDEFLPNITSPLNMNFTDTLIDWTVIDAMVMKSLQDNKLISDAFMRDLQGLDKVGLMALGVGLAFALIVASIPGIGQIAVLVAAAIGVALVIGAGIINIFKRLKDAKKFRISQFEYYKNDKKRKAEVVRFSNFMGNIHTQLTQLNNVIRVYQIAANEEQKCMLSIDNNYYVFTFTRNNLNQTYKLVVTDVENVTRKVVGDITSAPTDFGQLTSVNRLFEADESGAYVYLVNSNEEDKFDLTNYSIVISDINLDRYTDTVTQIITNALSF